MLQFENGKADKIFAGVEIYNYIIIFLEDIFETKFKFRTNTGFALRVFITFGHPADYDGGNHLHHLMGQFILFGGKSSDEEINLTVWRDTHQTHDSGYFWQGVR